MRLIFEDGKEFNGDSFGSITQMIGEVCVVNAMVGYQEIITDPDYFGKFVIMSYPVIGNYGMTDEDNESKGAQISGLIVRDYNPRPSNFRYTKTVAEVLIEDGVAGMMNVDTRAIIRYINEHGTMYACLTNDNRITTEVAENMIESHKKLNRSYNMVSKVWYSRTANFKYNVVALNLGIKRSLINRLNELQINVTIVPCDYPIEKILDINPDGIVISNGPENFDLIKSSLANIKALKGKFPILALGSGHLALALSHDLDVEKMAKGHFGGNHPILNKLTNKIETSVQVHQHVVVNEADDLQASHINTLDNSIEGLYSEQLKIISLQADIASSNYDHRRYFTDFVEMMKGGK